MELAECREMFEVLQDLGQYSGKFFYDDKISPGQNRGCSFINFQANLGWYYLFTYKWCLP